MAQVGSGWSRASAFVALLAGGCCFAPGAGSPEPTAAAVVDAPVVCWGSIGMFRPTPPEPAPITAGPLVGTRSVVCAPDAATGLTCFGNQAPGRDDEGPALAPIAGAPPDARALALGTSHGCALRPDGTVACWGFDLVGQLGRGTAPDPDAIGAIDLETGRIELPEGVVAADAAGAAVVDLSGVVEIAAGNSHTCARLESGGVRCWGGGSNGALGNGSTEPSPTPVDVVGVDDAIDLDASNVWSCVVRRDGSVWCWGSAEQYPSGTPVPDELVPVAIPGFANAVAISMRQVSDSSSVQATCALDRDGAVWCAEGRHPPQRIEGIDGAVELASGVHHTCARTAGGDVSCFGISARGQLGVETFDGGAVRVPGVAGARQIAAGRFFTCALRGDPATP